MKATLNIAELIEKNSLTRLSKDYEGKLLNKIKTNFTDNQQQLFVASFYCFLNYDTKKDFVIDFDNVWKWLGFSRKDNAKRLLEKFFTKDIDYQVSKAAPSIGGAAFEESKSPSRNLGGAGINKEQIMLTINTFKKFCLKSETKKADEVHDYYIKLEELLQETVDEENNELRLQLSNIENKFMDLSEKHFKLEENHKRILYKKKRHTLKKGPCLYLLRNPDVQSKIKVGISKNLNSRLSTYVTYFEPEFIFIIFTNSNKLLEQCVKEKFKQNISEGCDEWLNDIDTYEIISYIELQAKLLNLEFTSHQNIEEIKCESENESEDEVIEEVQTEDGIQEQIEENKLKTCSKCLINQNIDLFNKDKTKKDGYHGTCRKCEKVIKQEYKLRKEDEFVPLTEKKCVSCEELKDIINFSRHMYSKDGYVHNCLDCAKQTTNKVRTADKESGVRYKCGNCEKDYARKDTLTKHLKNCKSG